MTPHAPEGACGLAAAIREPAIVCSAVSQSLPDAPQGHLPAVLLRGPAGAHPQIATQLRLKLDAAKRIYEAWSMDFVRDQLADGRYFRVLAVVDQFSREWVPLRASLSIGSTPVGEALDRAIRRRGAPVAIMCDKGSGSKSRYFDGWAQLRKIDLDFNRPSHARRQPSLCGRTRLSVAEQSQPVENAFIGSFSGRLREECLNQNWFVDVGNVKAALAAWRKDSNVSRPHTSLGGLAPVKYVARLLAGVEFEEAV